MDASPQIREFIRLHEGNPLRAYRDPVGIPTIGVGFTNRSAIATQLLGKIVPGKTVITKAQSDKVFAAMLDGEYEPPVQTFIPASTKQYEFDAAVSVVWNLGAKALTWRWAKLWLAKDKVGAANDLANHYNTAKGKKLAGLVRRRKEEAQIFLGKGYPGVKMTSGKPEADGHPPEGVARDEIATAPHAPDPVVKEAQTILADRGFDVGETDGWMGPQTKAAIRAYQAAHPDLEVDGLLGPATLAQLRRDAKAAVKVVQNGIPTIAAGGAAVSAAGSFEGIPWLWIGIGVGVIVLAVAAFYAWKYRDVWHRRINTATGNDPHKPSAPTVKL